MPKIEVAVSDEVAKMCEECEVEWRLPKNGERFLCLEGMRMNGQLSMKTGHALPICKGSA